MMSGTLKRFIPIPAPFDLRMVQSRPVFGSDTGAFTLAGLPGILLQQETAGYQFSHHSGADTLDKVDESTLAKNAAVEAILHFGLLIASKDSPRLGGQIKQRKCSLTGIRSSI
jgi:hypothetical protein